MPLNNNNGRFQWYAEPMNYDNVRINYADAVVANPGGVVGYAGNAPVFQGFAPEPAVPTQEELIERSIGKFRENEILTMTYDYSNPWSAGIYFQKGDKVRFLRYEFIDNILYPVVEGRDPNNPYVYLTEEQICRMIARKLPGWF